MTPLHEAQVGKVSLSDEITMLERLWASLRSVKEQVSFIADSTGDADTKRMIGLIYVQYDIDKVELCLFRAKEQQREKGEEMAALSKELGRE